MIDRLVRSPGQQRLSVVCEHPTLLVRIEQVGFDEGLSSGGDRGRGCERGVARVEQLIGRRGPEQAPKAVWERETRQVAVQARQSAVNVDLLERLPADWDLRELLHSISQGRQRAADVGERSRPRPRSGRLRPGSLRARQRA